MWPKIRNIYKLLSLLFLLCITWLFVYAQIDTSERPDFWKAHESWEVIKAYDMRFRFIPLDSGKNTTEASRNAMTGQMLFNPVAWWEINIKWTWKFKWHDIEMNIDYYSWKNVLWYLWKGESVKVSQWYVFVKKPTSDKYVFIDTRDDGIYRGWWFKTNDNVGHGRWEIAWHMANIFNVNKERVEWLWEQIRKTPQDMPYYSTIDKCYMNTLDDSSYTYTSKIRICIDVDWFVKYYQRNETYKNLPWYEFEVVANITDYMARTSALKKFTEAQIDQISWRLDFYKYTDSYRVGTTQWRLNNCNSNEVQIDKKVTTYGTGFKMTTKTQVLCEQHILQPVSYQNSYNQYQKDKLELFKQDVLYHNDPPFIVFDEDRLNIELLNNTLNYDLTIKAIDPDPNWKINEVNLINWWSVIAKRTQPDAGTDELFTYPLKLSRTPATYTFTWVAVDNLSWVSNTDLMTITVLWNKSPSVDITEPIHRQTFNYWDPIKFIWDWTDEDGFVKTVEYYFKNEKNDLRTVLWKETRLLETDSFKWFMLPKLKWWVYDLRIIWIDDQWSSNSWKIHKIYIWEWARYSTGSINFNWKWITECPDDWDSPFKKWKWDLNDPKCAWPSKTITDTIGPEIKWRDCYLEPRWLNYRVVDRYEWVKYRWWADSCLSKSKTAFYSSLKRNEANLLNKVDCDWNRLQWTESYVCWTNPNCQYKMFYAGDNYYRDYECNPVPVYCQRTLTRSWYETGDYNICIFRTKNRWNPNIWDEFYVKCTDTWDAKACRDKWYMFEQHTLRDWRTVKQWVDPTSFDMTGKLSCNGQLLTTQLSWIDVSAGWFCEFRNRKFPVNDNLVYQYCPVDTYKGKRITADLEWITTCWYWDWEAPEVTQESSQLANTWTSQNIYVTWIYIDDWWSNLVSIWYKVIHNGQEVTDKFLQEWFQMKTIDNNQYAYKDIDRVNKYVVVLDPFIDDGVRYVESVMKDWVWNTKWARSLDYKIDKRPPAWTMDVSSVTLDRNDSEINDNTYANDKWKLIIKLKPECKEDGGACAPIGQIIVRKEDANNKGKYIEEIKTWVWCSADNSSSQNCTVEFLWDVSKVDWNDYDNDLLWRQYSLAIEIVDESWNRSWWNNFDWMVFPDIKWETDNIVEDISSKSKTWIYWNDIDSYNRKFRLRDKYGNVIIPADHIWRTIWLVFKYRNDVYIDQYLADKNEYETKSWVTVRFRNDTENTFFNISKSLDEYIWLAKTYDQSGNIKDGIYYWSIKSYVPTYYDDDESKFYYWQFFFNSIEYTIKDDIKKIVWGSATYQSKLFDEWDKNLRFNASIYPRFEGIPPLALEWSLKSFKTIIEQPSWSKIDLSNDVKLKVQYSWIDTFLGKADTFLKEDSSTAERFDTCIEWYTRKVEWLDRVLSCDDRGLTNSLIKTTSIQEKFSLKPWKSMSREEQWWFISSHIAVKYPDWNVWVWNWEIVWKWNYNYSPRSLVLDKLFRQNAISIIWLKWWSDYSKYNSITESTDRNMWWTVNKSLMLSDIKKKIALEMRWRNVINTVLDSKSVNFDLNNNTYLSFNMSWYTVYYFKWWKWSSILISWDKDFDKKILIITYGVDVYFQSDIQRSSVWSLWVIAMHNIVAGEYLWWNIYVKNDVTNLEAVIVAAWSMIWYMQDWTEIMTQEDIPQKDMNRQLYIKWSLITSNTMWASRSATTKCPFFVKGTCTVKLAQRYDLEYIRRFYIFNASEVVKTWNIDNNAWIYNWYDDNSWSLIGGVVCKLENDPASWDVDLEVKCQDNDPNLRNVLSSSALSTYNYIDPNNTNKLKLFSTVVLEYDPIVSQIPFIWGK